MPKKTLHPFTLFYGENTVYALVALSYLKRGSNRQIRDLVEACTPHQFRSNGNPYMALRRLEEHGFVTRWQVRTGGKGQKRKKGQRRTYQQWRINGIGVRHVNRIISAFNNLYGGKKWKREAARIRAVR
jgi:DNA-binding PadR family transcriptional regulator